jgi:chromosome segregation ATPase
MVSTSVGDEAQQRPASSSYTPLNAQLSFEEREKGMASADWHDLLQANRVLERELERRDAVVAVLEERVSEAATDMGRMRGVMERSQIRADSTEEDQASIVNLNLRATHAESRVEGLAGELHTLHRRVSYLKQEIEAQRQQTGTERSIGVRLVKERDVARRACDELEAEVGAVHSHTRT